MERDIRPLNGATKADLRRAAEWRGLFFTYDLVRTEGALESLRLVGVDEAEFSVAFPGETPEACAAKNEEAIEAAILRDEERMAREAEDFEP